MGGCLADRHDEKGTTISGPAHRDVKAQPVAAGSVARRWLAGRGWIAALAAVVVVGAIAALLALSLSSSSSHAGRSANGPSVAVGNSGLGKILVDGRGRTLYLFKRDTPHISSCTGACARVWPPLTGSRTPAVGAGVSRAKLTTITRADGATQVSYNGHPLYRFSEDTRAGQLGGQGFLGTWFAVSPAGQAVGKAAAAPSGY
jgi:predicted lipoprotein with Yx(FWY)xxD motif